jgi:hypothetical protein
MLAVGVRGDLVQPNMSNSHQSFGILSPKLIFRSEFVTHEMITLQYSRYFYGAEYNDAATSPLVMPWPYGADGTYQTSKYGTKGSSPDANVITLAASMWW